MLHNPTRKISNSGRHEEKYQNFWRSRHCSAAVCPNPLCYVEQAAPTTTYSVCALAWYRISLPVLVRGDFLSLILSRAPPTASFLLSIAFLFNRCLSGDITSSTVPMVGNYETFVIYNNLTIFGFYQINYSVFFKSITINCQPNKNCWTQFSSTLPTKIQNNVLMLFYFKTFYSNLPARTRHEMEKCETFFDHTRDVNTDVYNNDVDLLWTRDGQ